MNKRRWRQFARSTNPLVRVPAQPAGPANGLFVAVLELFTFHPQK